MGLFAEAAELEKNGKAFALVTITDTEGVVPRRSGRMIVSEDCTAIGTIGGGEIEYRAMLIAKDAIKNGKGGHFRIEHGHDGVVCIFVDIPIPSKKAVIVGSGHVGKAISSLLRFLKKTEALSVRMIFPFPGM